VSRLLPRADGVIVSDYRKGVITEQTARSISEMAASAGKPLITNPKPPSARWLRGARVLSLNQIEAEELAGAPLPDEDAGLRSFGDRLAASLDVDALMGTRGARGLCLWLRGGAYHRIPAHLVEVADIAGAGDTTIGTMALALICGATDVEAAELANLAGACVVRKHGVATITPEELLNAM
jgi:rfaE bifunctional protein kinase chain/domain